MITIAERKRALKLPDITEEMWDKIPDNDYKLFMDEFLSSYPHSKQTKKQYTSALRQFAWYKHMQLRDKALHKLKKRDILRYTAYLQNDRGMSTNGINLKKSAISSFFNHIENMVADDYEDDNGDNPYESFRNIARGLPPLPPDAVYEKEKVTEEELKYMVEELDKRGNELGKCWVQVAFYTGARRSELIQFKTSILNESFPYDDPDGFVMTAPVRGKGRGEAGKQNEYIIIREAYDAIKQFVDNRGYENEYVFTTGNAKNNRVISASWANDFCQRTLSEILHRRINPHIFKASCVTYMYEVKEMKLELISEHIAHHNSVDLTKNVYLLADKKEERRKMFTNKRI